MEIGPYVGLLIAPTLLAVFASVMEYGIKNRGIERNGAVGLRTKATQASDEAWHAGHEAALPHFRAMAVLGGITVAASILAILAAGSTDGNYPAWLLLVPGIGLLAQVVVVLGGTVAANKAAKAVRNGLGAADT
ncbi:MAG: SdpI family protein [Rhodococcus sp.]|nr:SdpI family protein [Rhodococcus sp. (in: high G+C Gram-positive bacteria)]